MERTIDAIRVSSSYWMRDDRCRSAVDAHLTPAAVDAPLPRRGRGTSTAAAIHAHVAHAARGRRVIDLLAHRRAQHRHHLAARQRPVVRLYRELGTGLEVVVDD